LILFSCELILHIRGELVDLRDFSQENLRSVFAQASSPRPTEKTRKYNATLVATLAADMQSTLVHADATAEGLLLAIRSGRGSITFDSAK